MLKIHVFDSDLCGIEEVKTKLKSTFQTTYLGFHRHFLGIKVGRCKKGVILSLRRHMHN